MGAGDGMGGGPAPPVLMSWAPSTVIQSVPPCDCWAPAILSAQSALRLPLTQVFAWQPPALYVVQSFWHTCSAAPPVGKIALPDWPHMRMALLLVGQVMV